MWNLPEIKKLRPSAFAPGRNVYQLKLGGKLIYMSYECIVASAVLLVKTPYTVFAF